MTTAHAVPAWQMTVLPNQYRAATREDRVKRLLMQVRWPTEAHWTHSRRLHHFIAKWFEVQQANSEGMPNMHLQCRIILSAVRPWELQRAVVGATKQAVGWATLARSDTHILATVIRHQCKRMDDDSGPQHRAPANRLPPIVRLVKRGDLSNAPEDVIAHQTNCVTTRAAGLARYLFHKFPYTDTYTNRQAHAEPGTTDV